MGSLKWRCRETAGSGAGDPRGEGWRLPGRAWSSNRPGSPAASLSRRAGFLGHNFVFPETPIGERLGETTLLCCSFTGVQILRPSFAEVLSPAPFGLGMAARPSVAGPALRRAGWGRRQISKTGASGEGGGRSPDCASLWRGSELEAPGSESRVHPPNPPNPPIHQGHPAARAAERNSLPSTVTTTNFPWDQLDGGM